MLKCSQRLVNGGVIKCLPYSTGDHRTECHLICADGFVPMKPDKKQFACDTKDRISSLIGLWSHGTLVYAALP